MLKSWSLMIGFTMLVAACSPSEGAVQTAIARTESAKPTATSLPAATTAPTVAPTPTPQLIPSASATATLTPTVRPATAQDIEPLLFRSGDLPAGFSGGQIGGTLNPLLKNVDKAEVTVSQELETGNS